MSVHEGGGGILLASPVCGPVFDPEATHAMGIAFVGACWTLGVEDRSNPVATKLARSIIERAAAGQRDPHRLRDQVVISLTR